MPADIVIYKTARQLSVTADGIRHSYRIALGKNWAADKEVEGDAATPLGEFYVCAKNPRSKYFLSLCISYPNAEDARRGLAAGLIDADQHSQIMQALRLGKMPPQHTPLGGEIYIHGRGARPHDVDGDWTRGCIALNDLDMRELYDLVSIGTKVVIFK